MIYDAEAGTFTGHNPVTNRTVVATLRQTPYELNSYGVVAERDGQKSPCPSIEQRGWYFYVGGSNYGHITLERAAFHADLIQQTDSLMGITITPVLPAMQPNPRD